ncbi:MAG: D-Ala-D-Ala carboxypeptidase family metallohydrolase [Cyanobacteria bacterium J06627_8]
MELIVLSDTVFKQEPKQSTALSASEKLAIKEGQTFKVLEHELAPGKHVKATLQDELGGEKTWFIFMGHVNIEGNEPDNMPKDEEDAGPPRKGGFKLPGYSSTFYLSDPVLPDGNFTWAEATKNGTRIPVDKTVVQGILKIADAMEEVRAYLGDRPITVNSWYRDPVTNRRVGGASRSRHLVGDAIDFRVSGINPHEVNRRLESWWGARGGLASASSFTHIDTRGYRARWSYGF